MHLVLVLAVTLFAACGASTPATQPASSATTPAAATSLGDPRSETIGGLKSGDDVAKVIALLGEPTGKPAPEEEGATGEYVSTWVWPGKGIALGMSSSTQTGPLSVRSISIEQPSTLTTSRGVGIGTPRADVERLYREFAWKAGDDGPEPQNNQLVVGTVYGGTLFTFDQAGKVSHVFVGAAAE